MVQKSIGYVTGHKFGGWKIPQKIQTAIMHFNANNHNVSIAYMITEYMDSKKNNILVKSLQKDKNIKNIFFTSALQINPTNKKVFNILKNYNLYFFLENMVIKGKSSFPKLSKFLSLLSKRKQKKFIRKNYIHVYSDYKKAFK